ncbi:MAG TPA: arginase [Planctomycetota bacterium]|nr:arginase [Planctomycetota bacterium]
MARAQAPARNVRLIGVPMDLGAGRRGVDMGPSAVRYAGLAGQVRNLGYAFADAGDISVPIPEIRAPGKGPRYLKEIQRACDRLATRVEKLLDDGVMPVVVGGDHSMAIGTITGVASHFRKRGEKIGLIWVDAHADMNTPDTSPSGNIHGMPLGAVMGYGAPELVNLGGFAPKLDPDNVALIGIRQVDEGEREIVLRSGIHYYEMMRVDQRGIGPIMQEAIEFVSRGTAGIHVSFDMDAVDPDYAPGVGTPVAGGLNMRESHLIMEMVADTQRLVALEIAELNPIHDNANATGQLVCDLVASALGKKVMGSPPIALRR